MAAMLCGTGVSRAATWTKTGVGDWFTSSNWNTQVPTSSTDAVINSGVVQISAGAAQATVVRIGQTAMSPSPTLELSSGGTLTNTNSYLAYSVGTTSAVTVAGAGTQWTMSGELEVGLSGNATLTISDQGKVTSGSSAIADSRASVSSITVTGAGSNWTISSNLKIGANGTGTLTISNGGTVTSPNTQIGYETETTGAAVVTGVGSTFSAQFIALGYMGNGSLTISDSASVVTQDGARLGWNGAGKGTLSLTSGGQMLNNGSTDIGFFGNATVTLTGGSKMTDTGSIVAGNTGVVATVSLDGASQWLSSGNLVVGESGTATVTIAGGSTVSSTFGTVGDFSAGRGTITVTGSGSKFTASTGLDVGYSGWGTLNLFDGGAVDVGTNTVTLGQIAESGGQIFIGNGGAPGTLTAARVTSRGTGTITFDHNAASYTFSPQITRTVSLVLAGPGKTILAGNNSFTGTTTLMDGTLELGHANALSGSTLTYNTGGGLLSFGALSSVTLGGLAGNRSINLGAVALTLGANNSTTTYSGNFSGSGSITKSGTGTLTLSGENSHAGATAISRGTLALGSASALGTSGSVSVASGATLNLNGYNQTLTSLSGTGNVTLGGARLELSLANDATISARLIGTGSVKKTGSAVATLSGSNTFSGGLTVEGGAVKVANNNALGSTSGPISLNQGTLSTTGSFTASRVTTLTTIGTIEVAASQTLTWSGVTGGDALKKTGAGTLVLSGANTYTGGTTLDAGTLTAGHASAFGTGGVRVNGGTLNLGNVAVGNALDVRGGTLTGLSAYVGTQTLRATPAYAGTVGGSLVVADQGVLNTTGATFSGDVTVQSGGRITGVGTLGSLTLAAGSALAPGNSPGQLNAGGTIWNGGSRYTWEINRATGAAGTAYDLLSISGTLTLAATSENPFTVSLVSLLANNSPGALLDFNAQRDSSYTIASTTGGILGFDPAAFTIDSSGFVDAVDGGRWSMQLTNGNRDLTLAFAAAIPEPATYAALAGCGALAVAGWRRRANRDKAKG